MRSRTIYGAIIGASAFLMILSLQTAIFWGQYSNCQAGFFVNVYCDQTPAMASLCAFGSLMLFCLVGQLALLVMFKDRFLGSSTMDEGLGKLPVPANGATLAAQTSPMLAPQEQRWAMVIINMSVSVSVRVLTWLCVWILYVLCVHVYMAIASQGFHDRDNWSIVWLTVDISFRLRLYRLLRWSKCFFWIVINVFCKRSMYMLSVNRSVIQILSDLMMLLHVFLFMFTSTSFAWIDAVWNPAAAWLHESLRDHWRVWQYGVCDCLMWRAIWVLMVLGDLVTFYCGTHGGMRSRLPHTVLLFFPQCSSSTIYPELQVIHI